MLKSKQSPEQVLDRLDWQVLRRLDGILQGDYRTILHGFGLDLAEIREYQYNDDVRSIDWNVTARMQVPYVRQYNEDRELTAWFVADLSPSLDFGSLDALKRNILVDFIALLSRILTRHGNRVGAIISSGIGEYVIPPGAGKIQVLRLIKELQSQPVLERTPFTDLGALIDAAGRIIRRRSLVFVLSDFLSVPGWEKNLGALCMKNEVLTVRIYDPGELELPDVGMVLIEDAETGEQLYIDTHDRRFRKRFREAADKRESAVKSAFSRAGVDALHLATDADLTKELVAFALRRKQLRSAPALHHGGTHVVSLA